jgi:hypothetical protein
VSKVTLFDLEERLTVLADSEPEPGQLELVQDWLADVATTQQAAVAKRDRVIQFVRHLDLQTKAIDDEIERLQGLKKGYAGGVKRLKHYIVGVMQAAGTKKLEGTLGKLVLMDNPSTAEIEDVERLPDAYCTVRFSMPRKRFKQLVNELARVTDEPLITAGLETTVDKRELLKDLKAGAVIPGADLAFGKQRVDVK